MISSSRYYTDAARGRATQCEAGTYCKDGTRYSCPVGTYGETAGLGRLADCLPCHAGHYGNLVGAKVATCVGECIAGYVNRSSCTN